MSVFRRQDTSAMQRLDPVDVLIVGSGMGGAAFAWRLAQKSKGLRILCLERGGWADRAQFPLLRSDWQSVALGPWATSPNLRLAAGGNPLSADYPIDDGASPVKPLLWCGVGGSTITWNAHFPRLRPSDFRTRSLDSVADDWPFGYDDLAPWYDLNDRMMGVSGLAGDPANPERPAREHPPLPFGRAGRRAADAFNDLGWHWWPVDAAILTRPREGRGACTQCGPCQLGCIPCAKASSDVTYWPEAIAAGVELRTQSTVTQVVVEAGRATGVVYSGGDGREVFQPAAHVVVCANGIGTPRLLLASGLARGPEDPLGKNLMFHPVAYVRGIFADALDGPAGPVGCMLASHEFAETDRDRGFVRGVQFQVGRENGLLAQAARLSPNWGASAQAAVAEEFRHSLPFLIMTEDLPEATNRVRIGERLAADGLPDVAIDYRVSRNTAAMLDFGIARAAEFFQAAGAVRTVEARLPPYTGWHLLGTARMGSDPATSVVDGRGRMHAAANITICDGSVMPTVGCVNPTSTIGALALKFADALAREIG